MRHTTSSIALATVFSSFILSTHLTLAKDQKDSEVIVLDEIVVGARFWEEASSKVPGVAQVVTAQDLPLGPNGTESPISAKKRNKSEHHLQCYLQPIQNQSSE